jgi:hypothetical protein
MKKSSIFLSVLALVVISGLFLDRAYASESQIITLVPGWNSISTPRVLSSHSFSASETVSNFDIYTLNPSDPSGWSTVTSELVPLYGYLINNKTGVSQTLTLNYQGDLTPNKRLFERDFIKSGWYLVGPADPSYMKKKGSGTIDTNNVSNILETIKSSYSNVIDFTDGDFLTNPDSVKVGSTWRSVVPADVNNLRDIRETKGYAIYINSSSAKYTGFQNNIDGVSEEVAAVVLAETTPNQSNIDAAQVLVNALPTGSTKTDLQARINAVQIIVDAANEAARESAAQVTAESAVSTYEGSSITTLTQVTAAEALKTPADTAVALVSNIPIHDAFSLRVSTRASVIASARTTLEASIGSLSITQYGVLPKTAVHNGENDIILERFIVSAGSNEDIAVHQITLTNTGTITNYDISNIRLRQVGSTTVLSGPVSISNKKATFNLGTPISLVGGASVNLEVIGNITGGNSRTIVMSVATGGVIATGTTSGTNIVSTGSTTGTTITISNETLAVSMSSSHPQGASAIIIKTTSKRDLAKFDVHAISGAVIINTITVKVVNATNPITTSLPLTSVGLYDGDSLVSNLITIDVETDKSFDLNWTISANATRTLTLKGITNNLAASPDTITTTFSGYIAYGLSSGEALTSTTDVPSTAITVYSAGTVTSSADTTKTPYSQAILVPINNVTLAALKLYALREDMKFNNLVISATGTGITAGDISSVQLYADDGVTALSNAVANDSGALTYTFNSSDFLSDIVVTKGAYRTILVQANIASGLNNVTGVTLTISNVADQLVFVGQDSGTEYDASAVSGVTFAIFSPYSGGTFDASTEIITIQKAATSPSGSIARGSQAVTAIWNVTNNSFTNTSITIDTIKFTSKTGLPSGLIDDTDDAFFMLYDGDGNKISKNAVVGDVIINAASGTINFTSASGTILTINPGETKQIKLVMNTTDTSKFPSSTQLQWSIEAVGDVVGANVGYATGTWSIPAVANVVTLP